ncbi:hypothetical protein N5U56_00665 [Aliarcobacter butzleri]|uniref:hypothetical protein n=2 Tax=Aliarcobacter butzleri TaxID=28197 RepID=UPI0021B280DF|nr:hypothetical protein [Aliarcobacter butzleri]MCT7625048.1 hypothetical protein [Aliarcobacter butzleri]
MMELIKSVFKYYFIYFIFMFSSFFCLAYFYFSPYLANDKPIALNDSNTYILLKKENIKIKDENVVNYIDEKLSYYNKYVEKQKVEVDETLEKKRVLLKSGIAFDIHKDSDCSIIYFIKNANILGKTEWVKEYTKLQKKEMPECNNRT